MMTRFRLLAGVLFATTSLVVVGSSAAATHAVHASRVQTFTFYTDVKNERFINNVDDLSRGEGHNPFGNVSSVKPPTNEKVAGPLAGDEAMYAFNLYTDANHTKNVGSVIFVCWYNFNRNALCDAAFQLSGGTLIGKGAFNFSNSAFTLAIVGGTSKYKGMSGAVDVTALGAGTQTQPVYRVVPMLQAKRMSFRIQPV
jgi:hypothetical protein